MSFACTNSAQPHYLLGHIVQIEVDVSRGLHSFSIVGMASKEVDEAKDRVSSAIKNSGYESPKSRNEKLVIALAPAQLKKSGAYHDLAIALAYLLCVGEISFDPDKAVFIGELSLDGSIKEVAGIIALVQAAQQAGFNQVFVPFANAQEAALVTGIDIYPVKDLYSLIKHLDEHRDQRVYIEKQEPTDIHSTKPSHTFDISHIRGQELAKRALQIAAAGGHNLVLYGPPGTGKTMLARAFCTILPPLSSNQALEVTAIHSIAGVLKGSVITQAPFRSPHHSSSYVAIIGGGAYPRPGEITLAHRGVLFLDEFPEFDKRVLESLRQPLEDRVVHIARSQGSVTFPASCIVICAMNPCPCGFYESQHQSCRCSAYDIERYQKKVSGPITDRMDMWVPVEHIDYDKLTQRADVTQENSIKLAAKVQRARTRAKNRQGQKLNAELSAKEINQELLADDVYQLLKESAEHLKLSPRSFHRVIKVARTIADLEKSETISSEHILEALQYRPKLCQ